jgi:hypothetical protein
MWASVNRRWHSLHWLTERQQVDSIELDSVDFAEACRTFGRCEFG